ncbi:hypothetical protein CONCODRAFT_71935 [Conidiobolus coronatus NRRL 28638]|uniref:F-box domain-containing protein n=1 Tax=Conidiobolus coronatus (strain ATCC 28846 / CBS 209.66 / NRRL 28638) TaxID=796925 RepID=A0A137P1J1_CONC2|nr:hypothetical protein CONCODRAFT_71935 [Conidiobolus coronatus NRRL 28638]|eukprot:KXN68882.1 hypothetical protein CONCODRAFT_71935 [Conidiobolus coronatus NRRL 28638]
MADSEINWAKLPKRVIKKIGSNIDNVFLLNVRLVNKRWLDSLNEVIFYSLENWSSEFIPELIKNHVCCIKSWSSSFRCEEYTQLAIEKFKFLESISWNNGDELLGPLNKLITKNPNIESLSIEIGDHRDQDKEFDDFISLVKNLKQLDTLELISDTDIEARPTRETVISPNSFEFHPDLEHVSLFASNTTYREYLQEYYGKELLLAFENSKFDNLKSFTWKSDGIISSSDVISLYNTSINITSKLCPNLTFLSLELCDSHLLSLISQKFPNLAQLNLNCPLPLPHSQNSHGSLTRLTKLAISGYYHDAVISPSTTQAIFPAVSTLKLQDSIIISNDFTTDLSKISTLFPYVKHLICFDSSDKWHTLLNTNDSYNWEELYIEANDEDAEKVMKLITKLPNLKILYLYNYHNDLKENGFKYDGDTYIIRASAIMDEENYVAKLYQRLNC